MKVENCLGVGSRDIRPLLLSLITYKDKSLHSFGLYSPSVNTYHFQIQKSLVIFLAFTHFDFFPSGHSTFSDVRIQEKDVVPAMVSAREMLAM